MGTERMAGGTPAASADGDPGSGGDGTDRRQQDRRQNDRRQGDRQVKAALPLALEAAQGAAPRGLPDLPNMANMASQSDVSDPRGQQLGRGLRSRGMPGPEGTDKTRCCPCGSRDVWLLHDGVLHLVGCRRCGRAGPGALSAPLAVEAWNTAEEARFVCGLPPDAEMMAPCVCEAPPPDAGVAVSFPAHMRPLGQQVMPQPVRVQRLSLYGVQLSGEGGALCPWLESTESALCELAMPMTDGRGWTLFALRVESVRREGDELFVGGGFVRQDDRQRVLLSRLLEAVPAR